MALRTHRRQSRNRDRLAPERLSPFLDMEGRHGQPVRPSVPKHVRDLIRLMSRANPTWGAPRIHGELLKLGMNIGETSVSKYMDRHRKPPSQGRKSPQGLQAGLNWTAMG